jgi:hypothetical protein
MGDRGFPSSQEDDVFQSMNQDFFVGVDYDISAPRVHGCIECLAMKGAVSRKGTLSGRHSFTLEFLSKWPA